MKDESIFSYREAVSLGLAGLFIFAVLAVSGSQTVSAATPTIAKRCETNSRAGQVNAPKDTDQKCLKACNGQLDPNKKGKQHSLCVCGKELGNSVGVTSCYNKGDCNPPGGLPECSGVEKPKLPGQECKDPKDPKCAKGDEKGGMPPMLPMPMPKPKMPMPNQDECMKPEKINTKECKCKKPENADDPVCKEGKEINPTLNDIFKPEIKKEDPSPKSIVEYGKDLFSKFFGNVDKDEGMESKILTTEKKGQGTTVVNTTGKSDVVPASFQSLQPPATPASPALQNANERAAFIPSDTFGTPSNAAQDFAARAEVAEAPGGIVSRIGAGARSIVDNLRRFFGLGG